MKETYVIKFSNGIEYLIPVIEIARDRAKHYAHEYNDNIEKSLAEDTIPLFEENEDEIIDWAKDNMKFADVCKFATVCSREVKPNFEQEWINNDVKLL